MSLAALEATLPAVLGLRTPLVKTCKGWDDLTESLLAAEQDYEEQGKERWRRIWHGLGDKADVVTPWIEIIPSEYGLAVVKSGVAVILKVCNVPSFSRPHYTPAGMANEAGLAGEKILGEAKEGFASL